MAKSKVSAVQVENYLEGMDYPAAKDEIIEHARETGAPKDVLETIEMIADREYESLGEISDAVSEA